MAVMTAVAMSVGLVAVSASGAQAAVKPQRAKANYGYTQVVVAPAVYQLIAGAGITPAPVGGATAYPYRGTLAANFPITGFTVANLRLKHRGGLTLTAGNRTIKLRNFYIDLQRGRVSAKVSGSIGNVGRADLFKIRFTDSLRLGLVKLTLTDTAAGALNTTFGVKAFAENATFGYATPRPFARYARMMR